MNGLVKGAMITSWNTFNKRNEMSTRLCLTWGTSKDLLDSTGNSAQYSVITLWSPGGRMGEGIVRWFVMDMDTLLCLTWEIHNFVNILKTTELLLEKSTHTHPPIFIAVLFTISKTWKQLKCASTDEWMKKMWYVYTMEYYSAIKKNKIMPSAATRMDLESVVLSESQKDRQHMVSLIWGIWKWR